MNKLSQLLSVLLISLFVVACEKQQTQEEMLADVDKLIATAELNKAEIILKNFLAKNNDSEIVREKLGIVLIRLGTYDNGLNQLNRIKSNLNADGFAAYIEALYMLQDIDNLIAEYESSNSKYPQLPLESKLVYALSKTRVTQTNGLLSELYESFSESEKDTLIAWLTDITVKFESSLDSAVYLAELKAPPTHLKADSNWLYLQISNSIATANQDHIFAAEQLSKFSTLRPNDNRLRIFRADALVKAQRWEDAELAVDEILNKFETQAIANQLKAKILIQNDDIENAKIHIERAINNGYESRENYLIAGELNFILENYEQTISQLERGLTNITSNTRFHEMLVYARAVSNNEQILLDRIDRTTLFSKGQISNVATLIEGLDRKGNQSAVETISQSLKTTPTSDPIIQLEASVFMLRTNQAEGAVQALAASKEVLNKYLQDPSQYSESQIFAAKNFVVAEIIGRKNFTEAEQTVNSWSAIAKDKHMNNVFLAEIYNASGQYDKTIRLLDPLVSELPDAHSYTLLASAYLQTRDAEKAFSTVAVGLQRLKYHMSLVKQFALLEKQLGKTRQDTVTALFDAPQTNITDALLLHFYFAIKGDMPKAIGILNDFTNEDQKQLLYWYTLAEAYLLNSDTDAAKRALNNVNKMQAPSFQHLRLILSTYVKVDDIDGQIAFVENNLPLFPGNQDLALHLSNLYVAKGDFSRSATILDGISSPSEDVSVAKAKLSVSTGKLNTASELYQDSMTSYGTIKTVIPYAEFLRELGQTDTAIRLLEEFNKKNPIAINSRVLLATMLEQSEAITLYQDVLRDSPNNYIALNNLAWQLYEKGELENAMQYAERALKLMPNNPNVLNTFNTIKDKL